MIGSTFRGITLMMAFCAADLSDSTAATSASPVWPSPACRVAMSSQGQRTASCSWGPALMLPAAAAGSGHTYRSGTCPHPAAGSSRRQSSSGFWACGPSDGEAGERGQRGSVAASAAYRTTSPVLAITVSLPWCHVLKGRWELAGIF